MWFVSKIFLGTPRHLVVERGNIRWLDKVNPGILGYAYPNFHPLSLMNFLAIAGKSLPSLLPANIRRTLEISKIPRELSAAGFLMRPEELRTRIVEFVAEMDKLLLPLLPYLETYARGMKVLAKCQDAKYSVSHLKIADPGRKINLNRDGYAPRPIYNLSNGKTGRMTIVSGSQMLTAPREVKECIRSRFEGGAIVEIDYSALEPRTALAIIGSDLALSADIYEHVAGIFSPRLSREKAKQVTISFLYGAAKSTIRHFIDATSSIDAELDGLRELFGFDEIVNSAITEISENGFFRNHAGRPISPQSSKRGLLFNNFCQSSAVDVALSGFSHLLKYIEDNLGAIPLYFIHDALILDVPPGDLDALKDASAHLPTYLGVDFPTKIKILHN